MNRFWLKSGVVAVTAAWSLAAFAQSSSSTVPASATPPAAGTSVTGADVTAAKKSGLPIGVVTDGILYGPRVNTPTDNKITGDANVRDGFDGIFLRQKISAIYKFSNGKTSIAPTLDFVYQLSDPDSARKHKQQFRWKDSYVKIGHKGIAEGNIAGNAMALDGDFRWFLPTSELARQNNTFGAARLSLNPSIQFGKSPFSISAVNYAKYWFQRNDNVTTSKTLQAMPMAELYTGPQVNYSLNDNVTAFVLYEAIVNYDTSGMPTNSTQPLASQSDFEPGVEVKLHDRVSLTPFLNWYTNQPLYTTTLNLNAVFTLL